MPVTVQVPLLMVMNKESPSVNPAANGAKEWGIGEPGAKVGTVVFAVPSPQFTVTGPVHAVGVVTFKLNGFCRLAH